MGYWGVCWWGGLRFGENFEAVFGKLESGSATWVLRANFPLDQEIPRKT